MLAVFLLNCPGHQHYIVGNPHTFPGRMSAWCPELARELAFSKNEIFDVSEASRSWIEGFPSGNEPPPPMDGSTAGAKMYDEWLKRRAIFHNEGDWPIEE